MYSVGDTCSIDFTILVIGRFPKGQANDVILSFVWRENLICYLSIDFPCQAEYRAFQFAPCISSAASTSRTT